MTSPPLLLPDIQGPLPPQLMLLSSRKASVQSVAEAPPGPCRGSGSGVVALVLLDSLLSALTPSNPPGVAC